MANRPPALCHLQRGKLIDTQANFTDTFNWLVASMSNLQGGTNCRVEWTASDTPVINVNDNPAPNGGGSGGGGGTDNPVVSITAEDSEGGVNLRWTYADGTEDSHLFSTGGPSPYSGVTELNELTGDVTLTSASNSNV